MVDKYLAPGLSIHCELAHAGAAELPYGCFEVRDERGDASSPRQRISCLFPAVDKQPWCSELLKRLHLLSLSHLDHVSRPLELGRTDHGSLYVILDKFENPLAAELTESGLTADPDGNRAWALFEQLVAGLTGLHRLGMAHGNLCPSDIHLDRSGQAVWITGTAWGPLAWWSEGKYLDGRAPAYYPPEYKGRPHPPSTRADIFALGRILQEMLAGAEEDSYPKALARLSRRRRGILRHILAPDPRNRPADADDLQRRLDASKTPFGLFSTVAVAAAHVGVVVFLVLGSFFLGSFFLESRLETLSRELAAPLSKQLPTLLSKELTITLSRELAGPLSREVESRDKTVARLEQAKNGLERDRVQLKAANDDLRAQIAKLTGTRPPAPRSLVTEDPKDIAARRWAAFMEADSLTWKDMEELISRDHSLNQQVRDVLWKWRDDFEKYPERNEDQGRRLWWIRPVSGIATDDSFGKTRQIEIVIGNNKTSTSWAAHEWDEATQHKYEPEWTGVPWALGDSLTIAIYGARGWTGARRLLAKTSFGGPCAIWRLQRDKKVGDPVTVSIDFEVYECPGPAGQPHFGVQEIMNTVRGIGLIDR